LLNNNDVKSNSFQKHDGKGPEKLLLGIATDVKSVREQISGGRVEEKLSMIIIIMVMVMITTTCIIPIRV